MIRKSNIAIVALFLLIYILPLGVRPMVIPDETRYAEVPREMLASGDWVVPRLDGIRFFHKPPLGYWLNAAAMTLFGENAFAVRLPSAMSVGISALFVFLLVRKFTGRHLPAILAAVILITSAEVLAVGVFNVLDSLLSMFLTAGMVSFFFAHTEVTPWKRLGFLALFGLSCGLAFLTKGFLAFAVPVVAIVPFLIWEHRWKDLFRVAWLPIVVAVLVALPWTVMIHFRGNDFWNYFFWTEHIRRFMSDSPQHPRPFWFFIPVIAGYGLPWTVFLPAATAGVRRLGLRHPLVRFAVCWFLFPFLIFSTSSGKLPTYILPCFPPLAILISMGLLKYFEAGKTRAFTAGTAFLAGIMGLVGILLLFSHFISFPGLKVYGQGEHWKWAMGSIGLLLWSLLLVAAARSADTRRKLVIFAGAPVLFMFIAQFIMPNLSKGIKAPGEFLMGHLDRVPPNTVLVSDGKLAPAVCWFYKRQDVYLLTNNHELSYGIGYPDSKHRLLSVSRFATLVNENIGKSPVILISETKNYAKYKDQIPKPVFEDASGAFVFSQFQDENSQFGAQPENASSTTDRCTVSR
jgi:4-amino-4-deoxy-L-arabinose transferase